MSQQVPDNVFLIHKTDFKLADGLVDTIQALHKQHPSIRLYIIDTYSRARGAVKSIGANAYDADVAFLEPLQRMATDENIAILCIHHDKKGAGMVQDSFERLSGTMGISGSADCVLNLVADGAVREPLVVWNGVIIDGHHRWKIIQKHPEIPYTIKEMDFADRWAAISWMCSNQLGRRNVTDEQRTYLLGKLYEARKNTIGGDRGNQYTKVAGVENRHMASPSGNKTRATIAAEQGTTESAVRDASFYAKGLDEAEKVSPGIREKVLSGEVKAPKSAIVQYLHNKFILNMESVCSSVCSLTAAAESDFSALCRCCRHP